MLNLMASAVFVLVQMACSRWLGLTDIGILVPLVLISLSVLMRSQVQMGKRLHTTLVVISAIALWGPLFKSGLLLIDANAFAQAFAQFLLAVQSLELVRQRSDMDTNYLPGLGAITFALLLISSEEVLGYRTTLQMTFGFLVALVWGLRPELPMLFFGSSLMRHKGNTLLMLLTGVLLIGSFADQQLSSQLPSLQQRVQALRGIEIDMVSSQRVAGMTPLVDRVGLNSQVDDRLDGPETVLFEVAGSQPPGYMRTVSFTQFDGERWRNRWDGRGRQGSDPQVIQPAKQPPSVAGSTIVAQSNQPWFAFEKGERDQQFDHFEVMLPFGRGALVPVPIGSQWIQCDLNSRTSVMLLDVHGNIWPGSINNQRYRLLVSPNMKLSEPSARKPSDTYLASLLSIPSSERSWVEQAKSRVFRSGSSFDQRCSDVEQFFISEFEYATENDIEQVRGKRTKLQTFMEDRKAAHCEYFAAATVLLLRSQSIPARLSTGYLVYEYDNDEENFAARKRNAHAWAEAYDAATDRWQVVESTPGTDEYIERFSSPDSRVTIKRIKRTVIPVDYQQAAWQFWGWCVPGLAVLYVAACMDIYRPVRACAVVLQHLRADASLRWPALFEEVRRADRLAKRLGYERALEETCVRFGRRLASDERPEAKQLATWYAEYGRSRYQG